MKELGLSRPLPDVGPTTAGTFAQRRRALTALTVGHVTHDRYGSEIVAGGCAFYGARTFQALGARTRLVTSVGGDFARAGELAGLDIAGPPAVLTTTFTNVYEPRRPRRQWVEAQAEPLAARDIPSDWRSPDVAFLAPVLGEVDVAGLLETIEARVIGLGLQGLLKAPAAGAPGRCRCVVRHNWSWDSTLDGLRRRHSVVFVSEEDLECFSDIGLLDALRARVPWVVFTEGRRGCTVFSGGQTVRASIFPTMARDPTGAGDTFAAAFLYALADGAATGEAARLASAAASVVVEAEGGSSLSRLGECFARARNIALRK